jgi:hypothetical protein
MQKIILSFHPIFQALAILLAFYGAYLGLQRTRSLHFGKQGVGFQRQRHGATGAIALFMLLGGMVGGKIIASVIWQGHVDIHLHGDMVPIILPFLLIGIGTGLYLYFVPAQRKVLPAVHGINNFILLILLLVQAYSGMHVYLEKVWK